MAVLLLSIVMTPVGVFAQKVPTPVATAFNIEEDEDNGFLIFGWHLTLGLSGRESVGLVVTCDRTTAVLEAMLFFSFFPANKPVQLAVRTPEDHEWFHGKPVIAGERSGFHSPILSEPDDVQDFLDHAMRHGSLISNGHNSFWNKLPEEENRRAREALGECGSP